MKKFPLGFFLTLLAFLIANVTSYYVRTDGPGAADAINRVGFPFLFREDGGLAYRHAFNHAALWANLALALSTCVGLKFRKSAP